MPGKLSPAGKSEHLRGVQVVDEEEELDVVCHEMLLEQPCLQLRQVHRVQVPVDEGAVEDLVAVLPSPSLGQRGANGRNEGNTPKRDTKLCEKADGGGGCEAFRAAQ